METSFSFVGHSLNKERGEVVFNYEIATPQKTYSFTESLLFPEREIDWKSIPDSLIKSSLDNLLIMLGISYWKLLCPTVIKTPTILLNHEQAIFWDTVYTKGLGEFFYKNNIDFTNLIHFPFVESTMEQGSDKKFSDRSLLFFGGGKDSIAAAELLKKQSKEFTAIVINPTEIHKKALGIVGKDSIFIARKIDQQLFALNKQNGFLNGHVPATAINDFIGIFCAILYDYKYVISSNEKSADFGNVKYLGQEINHQWSKSLEFEKMFSNYIQKFITKNLTYFSLLRPLSEIKIAEIFSNYEKYFYAFSSCNKNFVIAKQSELDNDHRWCGECPKCLFVFILLAAFLPKEKVVSIFGKNLLADDSLLPLLKKLLGVEKIKPFECVGTPEETTLAMLLTEQKGEFTKDALMDYFIKEIFSTITNPQELQEQLLLTSTENMIPEEFRSTIEQ